MVGALFVSGHILLFFLLTGVYLIQYSALRFVGLFGYVLVTIGNSLFIMIQTASSFVLSRVDISDEIFPAASPTTGIVFGIGLLLLAVANSQTRALPSWPGWLMFMGMALNLILPPLLGEAPDIVFAIPPLVLGLGVAGFGWALRRN